MRVGLPAFIVSIAVRDLAFDNVVVLALFSFSIIVSTEHQGQQRQQRCWLLGTKRPLVRLSGQ